MTTFGRTQYYQHLNVVPTLKCEKRMNSANGIHETAKRKLLQANEIHVKWKNGKVEINDDTMHGRKNERKMH